MRQNRRAPVGGLWALMLVIAAGLASAQEARPTERLLIVPFENAGRDGRLFWMSEGAATLLTGTLESMGVGAVSRGERLKAFERLQLPSAASLSEATIIRTAQILGATDVVMGSVSVADGQITVTARALRLDTGRMRPPLVETGPLNDFFAVFERLARQLAPSAPPPPAAAAAGRGSLTVFENYIKGLVAETTDAQIRFLGAALKLAPVFAPARIALWQVYTAQGDHAKAAAAALAVPAASPEYRRARFLVALSRIHQRQYDEAFALLKALVDASPSPTALNNLGVIQARRGATPETGSAAFYFTKAAEADPGDSDYAFNVGYAGTGWTGIPRRPSTGSLRRCGAAPRMATRTSCWAPPCWPPGPESKGSARRNSPASCPRPTSSGSSGPTRRLSRCRAASSGCATIWTRRGRHRWIPTARPRNRRTVEIWPRFTRTVAAACSSSSRTKRRFPS